MSNLRRIDPKPFMSRIPTQGRQSDVGERPELQWLKIDRLRIDPNYQREIGRRGADNIVAIVPKFKWAKFTPVVVAPIGEGLFAIIDGQHRTTAASACGFESVPCVIIQVDGADQADAFVAINANVTAMSPLQLHAARLAAGNSDAAELTEVCRAADVTICRYPVPANKMKPGETLAVGMLQSVLAKFGREVLITALCCITKTRRGNPGMIRKQIVQALCAVLEAESAWLADRDRLIFAMQTFDFAAQFIAASAKSIEAGETVSAILVETIAAHLDANRQLLLRKRKVVRRGVLTIGPTEVSGNGQRLRIAPRASLLLQALDKAKPNCVGDEWLIQKLWSVRRPNGAVDLIDQLIRDLDGLKALGFEIRTLRGVGRQLVEVA
jgi:hypothetical protein